MITTGCTGFNGIKEHDDVAHRIHTLKSLMERTEPFFERDGRIVDAVVAADVTITVDDLTRTIRGGPFRLPVTVGRAALLVGCTRGWAGGSYPDKVAKDVRLEVSDASMSWCEPERFAYPILNYRWRASNYQHTYLGIVVNQARLYYHRGEDMGMSPDLEPVRAMTDGTVIQAPPVPQGDKGSNVVVVQDPRGMMTRYVHMNAPNVVPGLAGTHATQGQKIGLTGNTFNNHRSPSPHLHISMNDEAKTYRNTFPMIVAAYRKSFPGELLSIAGNVRFLYAGGEITLDGSLSLAGEGTRIKSHEWTFCDGGQAATAQARRRYPEAGVYSEQLRVTDDHGRSDLDFVEVNVFERNQKLAPPRAWINYYPIRGIRPDTEVRFLIRQVNLKHLTINYGYGQTRPWQKKTTHRYAKPGAYVVTVKGEDTGAGPGLVEYDRATDGRIERQDDVSSCAYFYLDKPENGLPALAPFKDRIKGLE